MWRYLQSLPFELEGAHRIVKDVRLETNGVVIHRLDEGAFEVLSVCGDVPLKGSIEDVGELLQMMRRADSDGHDDPAADSADESTAVPRPRRLAAFLVAESLRVARVAAASLSHVRDLLLSVDSLVDQRVCVHNHPFFLFVAATL